MSEEEKEKATAMGGLLVKKEEKAIILR